MPAGVAFYQLPGEGDHSKRNVETVSLFDLKRTNGWWPAVGTDDGQQILPLFCDQETCEVNDVTIEFVHIDLADGLWCET